MSAGPRGAGGVPVGPYDDEFWSMPPSTAGRRAGGAGGESRSGGAGGDPCRACPGCRPSVGGAPYSLVCPELIADVDRSTFYARVAAALVEGIPEVTELSCIYGRPRAALPQRAMEG